MKEVIVALFGGSLCVLAQQDGLPPWLTTSSAVSGTVILAWYAYHNVTRTIPDLLAAHREEQAAARETFEKLMTDKDNRHDKHTERLEAMLTDSMQSDRRAVHDTRDLAQTVISKVELEQKKHSA